MRTFNLRYDEVTGLSRPMEYPGDKPEDDWTLPDSIKPDFSQLCNVIELKYPREFLKVCAFYNKMFPSLKGSGWTKSSYNTPPFTTLDQERLDTGTGIAQNYLKQIVDQVTSRLGTFTYDAAVLADVPTLEYILYKDEVERLLRKHVRSVETERTSLEVFHDAAILGYSHVIIDPFTHEDFKASDWEVGCYEAQFNKGKVRQLLYRDYCFPVTELPNYLVNADDAIKEKVIDGQGSKPFCDFKLYFDCPEHKAYAIVAGDVIAEAAYPFETVQMSTFSWDVGMARATTTSLFDLLYPVQRELNKAMAKLQQLIRMYKGPVPVFNSDVDLAMKAISNGSGEALYVDSARPVDQLMTVINPTPLDAELTAQITARKTEMYELAGIQQVSFDLENMRSAAAVIALEQTRDTVFQSQMMGRAAFIKQVFKTRVNYNAAVKPEGWDASGIDWEDVKQLMDDGYIELKPVHLNDPLGHKSTLDAASGGTGAPDYARIQLARAAVKVLRNELTYDDVSFMINKGDLASLVAASMVKMDALEIDVPEPAHSFMISAYIDYIKQGGASSSAEAEPAEEEAVNG